MKSYSCIIPVYNEESRILGALQPITRVKEIKQIICVDDGSTDNSATIIKKNFPKITLLQQKTNLGKTAAIKTGLHLANHDGILLLDSDLLDVKSQEVSNVLLAFEKYHLDCLLLNTAPTNIAEGLIRPICRFLLLAAGNRVVKKQWLLELLEHQKVNGYELEIAQNKYLMKHNMNVAYMDVSARDVSKVHKIGWIKGWVDEAVMWYQIITYAGLLFFIQQSLFFARRKVYI